MTKEGGGGAGAKRPRLSGAPPTMDQIQSDRLTKLAEQYWLPSTLKSHLDYDASVVEDIYETDLKTADSSLRRVVLLEYSQYLESYLWPNFDPESSSDGHALSIVLMVNEKFRERIPAWNAFQRKPEPFEGFFRRLMSLSLDGDCGRASLREQVWLLTFLGHCFSSLEVDLIRGRVQRLVSLSMWASLSEGRREEELKRVPKWRKFWKAIAKKDAKVEDATERKASDDDRRFLRRLVGRYFDVLDGESSTAYCERFLNLVVGLESLLPTRRFFNVVLDDSGLLARSTLAPLRAKPEGKLFGQLLEQVRFYARFEISEETGESLDDRETSALHYERVARLQLAVFASGAADRRFALSTVASVDDRDALEKLFRSMEPAKLREVAERLCVLSSSSSSSVDVLVETLVARHERRDSQLRALNETPLYPTESVIWDDNVIPGEFYNGEDLLALPRLNLQFLTLHDYLWRNMRLFQMESTYEIRGDVEDAVTRLKAWTADDGQVVFNGWARMALPVLSFTVVQVAKPNVGEKQPSRVRADVSVNLNVKDSVKSEWEGLRRHDVCLLLTVRPPPPQRNDDDDEGERDPRSSLGIVYVRGCEVEGMLDENGRVIEEGPEPKPALPGDGRTFRVKLDCNQYRLDMDEASAGREDVCETFNVIVRRKPKENNFKAVLETIRELMNARCVVPDFLHDLLLGYGDPAAAHYRNFGTQEEMEFRDTFLSFDHLRQCFPGHDVVVVGDAVRPETLVPPFKVQFEEKVVKARPYLVENRGPYPHTAPRRNAVPFTPTQVEAIRSGMHRGLTMVVGPPGTGKTDVAVQIISNLYHSHPGQRILVVTHSNQALNQLFEKVAALDVDERHLLRLGHGEEALETEKDFSRYGRVNYVLGKRIQLLAAVDKLKDSIVGLSDSWGDVGYTCETAGHFFLYEVQSRWERFLAEAEGGAKKKKVADAFPFAAFFADAPKQPLFCGVDDDDDDMETALGCWRYIEGIFRQLEEFRAFELLRTGLDRSRYLCVKEAKIVAMTCTHAALKRKELVEMGFRYDTVLMEESAQILEIETFVPLLLQNPDGGGRNRLKRWIMIGDHHQLPPVVKNMAFQKFSNMEQSLFARLVRLGVPTVDLDAQGRARPSLCRLYDWRYRKLGNLPHVLSGDDYLRANGGFSFDYQLVDVGDFNGCGETQPSPFFYQNLAEAEYVVATFMYMRLLGYPADSVVMLTTYNGQKHLLRDVVEARCAGNPLVGRPAKITTVDKFQGQQSDHVLLSLVRTRNVGHLRDVRRLVVAMSRARLGLYVFARARLFRNCFELQPAFNLLCKRPTKLHLCPDELHAATGRQANVNAPNPLVVEDMPQMCRFVYDFYASKVAAMAEIAAAKPAESEQGGREEEEEEAAAKEEERKKADDVEEAPKFSEIVNEVANS